MKPDTKPDLNPSEADYERKFGEITSSPENQALDDQLDTAAREEGGFSDEDKTRQQLARQESSSQQPQKSAAESEEGNLYNPESMAAPSRAQRGFQGILNGFSKGSAKKKMLIGAAGLGGGGLIVGIVMLLFMLISGFGIGQVAEVMKLANYTRLHLASTRRTTQYITEKSLNPNPEEFHIDRQRRTLWQRFSGFDPNEVLANLRQQDELAFVTKDGTKKRFGVLGKDITTTELDYIQVGRGGGGVPTASRRWNPVQSYRQQKQFVQGIEEGIASSDLFAGKSRLFRTRAANAIIASSDIQLYRWVERGRKIKTFKDALLSLHDRLKGDSSRRASAPEINETADDLENALEEAGDNPSSGASLIDDAREIATSRSSAVRTFRNFARGASISALGISVYCSGFDYLQSTEENSKERVKQYKEAGLITQSAYDQMKKGDTTATAVMMEAKSWDGFSKSQRYQETVGNPNAANLPKDLDRSESPVADTSSGMYRFYNALVETVNSQAGLDDVPEGIRDPIIGAACRNANSTPGTIAISITENLLGAIAGVLTAGVSTGGQQAVRVGLQQGFRQTVRSLVTREVRNEILTQAGRGVAIDATLYLIVDVGLKTILNHTGNSALDETDKKYAKADIGNKLFVNDMSNAFGARELTKVELGELDSMVKEQRYASLKKKPLYARLASLAEPLSPASQIVATLPYSPQSLKTSSLAFAQKSFNPLQTIAQNSSRIASTTLGSNKVLADAVSDDAETLDIPTIGWSKDELEKMYEDTYWPLPNADYVENMLEQNPEAFDSIKDCFTPMTESAVPACNKDKLTVGDDNLTADQKFRYRLYQMDGGNASEGAGDSDYNDGVLGSLLDLQEITENSGNQNGDAAAPDHGDPRASTDSIPCPANTTDLGTVVSKYTAGGTISPPTLRLCQLSSIPGRGNNISGANVSGGAVVNSRVAGSWQNLGQAASAAGISLSATSSFRLADSCGGTGDGSACARPGTSMHQLGIAIDFTDMGAKGGSTTSCSQRKGIRPGATKYAEWKWLFDHAEKYGFKQYSYEPWHWDNAHLLGLANRCDSTMPATVL